MKTRTKVALTGLCALLLVAASVLGTLAYLTATDEVTNTFTVGNIAITLDEAKVTEYGVKDGETRVKANTLKLIPGHTYAKDPTVHVTEKSEASYIFVKVVDEIAAIEDDTTVAKQITANGWTQLKNGEEEVAGVYYKEHAYNESKVDYRVFETLKIISDADVASYDNKTLKVTAYAIQKDSFENKPYEAWTAVTAAYTPAP